MKTLKKINFFIFTLILISFYSCSNSESGTNNMEGIAPKISVKLVDAPGDFDEVNVNVVGVMIKMDDSDDDSGWINLDMINTGIIDLLNLTGGVNQVLVDRFPIPAGTLKQIRLVLGDGNTIVIRNDSAFLIYKDENDSIIRFRFINIESLREYTIKHKDKDYTIDYLVNQKLVVCLGSIKA